MTSQLLYLLFSAPVLEKGKDLWVETRSPAGKVYFYCAKTRKTSWTKPSKAQIISQQQFLALALANAPNAAPSGGGNKPGVPQFQAPQEKFRLSTSTRTSMILLFDSAKHNNTELQILEFIILAQFIGM